MKAVYYCWMTCLLGGFVWLICLCDNVFFYVDNVFFLCDNVLLCRQGLYYAQIKYMSFTLEIFQSSNKEDDHTQETKESSAEDNSGAT